jgi:hypothetical protein
MPGIADKFTQSAQKQTAMAGHDEEGGGFRSRYPLLFARIKSANRLNR